MFLNKSQREFFLDSLWKPYPSSPLNVVNPLSFTNNSLEWLVGRLKWLDKKNLNFTLLQNNQIWECQFTLNSTIGIIHHDQIENLKELHPKDIFINDDLVLVNINKIHEVHQICLLTPCLDKNFLPQLDVTFFYQWNDFIKIIRKYFESESFVEVSTPTLVTCPGFEIHLHAFETEFHLGSKTEKMFLPTSPELSMKKFLTLGISNIFEIKKCFRNQEFSNHHQPEFTLLEWYRSFSNLDLIKKDLSNLLRLLTSQIGDNKIEDIESISVTTLFRKYFQFELTPYTQKEELETLALRSNIHFTKSDTWEDLFHLLFLTRIEPNLLNPIFVEKYPHQLAALSRLDREGWADRIELYWKGVELANGFNELNSPVEHENRWQEIVQFREKYNYTPWPKDKLFFKALEHGFPPAAGIALGLDRLFMILHNQTQLLKSP